MVYKLVFRWDHLLTMACCQKDHRGWELYGVGYNLMGCYAYENEIQLEGCVCIVVTFILFLGYKVGRATGLPES